MRFLGNKEKKQLIEKLPIGYLVDKKDELKEKNNVLYKGDEKLLIIDNSGNYLPHLKSIPEDKYKAVYVDRGAIPFIIKGADLMRPGIQIIEKGFEKDEIIMIKDEEHKKLLALGFAMFNSQELESIEKGKVVKVFHYFNDDKY